MNNAIEATNLGKRYLRRTQAEPTLVGAMHHLFSRQPHVDFWALRGVSFTVPAGQTVGVIGPNGSGKSSLLGLVAGTITPTTGAARTQGRVASLLELGAGFHPDLTGRENVYLYASVLGIPREDVRKRIDHIVEFSGLRDFLDMPVKNYSSGMYVRLGFAVAVELDPDVLLVDEVLAVGDMAFQMKCYDRIRDLQKRNKTILFVSHDLTAVEQFCHDVKLIHQGALVQQGDASEVILQYMKSYMQRVGMLNVEEHGTRDIEMTRVRLLDEHGAETKAFTTGMRLQAEISYRCRRRIDGVVFGYSIKTSAGFFIFGTNTQIMKQPIDHLEGEGVMRLSLEPLQLLEGKYVLSLAVHSADHATQFHRQEDWYPFAVRNPKAEIGVFQLPTRWQLG